MTRVLFAAMLVLTSCGVNAPSTVPGADVVVHVHESTQSVGRFDPQVVRISAGQSVGWINDTEDSHTITFLSTQSPPDTNHLTPGSTFKVTFDQPGTYRYFCRFHPGMQGEIDVGG